MNLAKIKKNRYDLSSHLIHFTKKNDSASAFEILKQIINDGVIKCNWAIRNGKNTVCGDKPAVCFTSMPLHSFWTYAENRNRESNYHDKQKGIDHYGIALPFQRMFIYGTRNVIYGTTNYENEIIENGKTYIPEFPKSEQYRFMLTTDFNGSNDWTHEREWRWISQEVEMIDEPFLPVWRKPKGINLKNCYYMEGPIFIITRYEKEVEEIKKLFSVYDKTFAEDYFKDNLLNTYAFSFEKLIDNDLLNFEIGFKQIFSKEDIVYKLYGEEQ